MRQECKICGRTPHEIPEYTEAAEIEEMAVEAYVEDYDCQREINEAQERYKKS